jgi:putative membrane protein
LYRYSTDEELMLRDRGGKPRVPDIIKDKEEMDEFRKLEPWNRPNVVVSKITAIIEHHRRMGNLVGLYAT